MGTHHCVGGSSVWSNIGITFRHRIFKRFEFILINPSVCCVHVSSLDARHHGEEKEVGGVRQTPIDHSQYWRQKEFEVDEAEISEV